MPRLFHPWTMMILLMVTVPTALAEKLQFEIDPISAQGLVSGYAFDEQDMQRTVMVRLEVDNIITVLLEANAASGDGTNHGFSWLIPREMRDEEKHSIVIYAMQADGNLVKITPHPLEFTFAWDTMPKVETKGCSVGEIAVPHASSRRFYKKAIIGPMEDCVAISELRKCNNGVLSGSYEFPDCSVETATCGFEGKTLWQGDRIIAFEKGQVDILQECKNETRVCRSGILSGSFQYANCSQIKKDQNSHRELEETQESYLTKEISFFEKIIGAIFGWLG